MSTEDRVEATMKNVEGKAKEMIGEVTGDPETKAEGKMKQAEAKAEHTVENAKEKVS